MELGKASVTKEIKLIQWVFDEGFQQIIPWTNHVLKCKIATLQDWMNGWWVTISDGCNCNRTTLQTIQSVKGWQVEWWDLEYDAPPNLDRMAVGIATKKVDGEDTLNTSSTPARM